MRFFSGADRGPRGSRRIRRATVFNAAFSCSSTQVRSSLKTVCLDGGEVAREQPLGDLAHNRPILSRGVLAHRRAQLAAEVLIGDDARASRSRLPHR